MENPSSMRRVSKAPKSAFHRKSMRYNEVVEKLARSHREKLRLCN